MMAKLKFERDGISVDVDKEELKEIFSAYFQMLMQKPTPKLPEKDLKKLGEKIREEVETKTKVIPRPASTEKNIIEYIRKNPNKPYKKIGKVFGLERTVINEIAIKHGIRVGKGRRCKDKIPKWVAEKKRKRYRRKNFTRSEIKKVKDFVLQHPELTIEQVEQQTGMPDGSMYHHFPEVMEQRKDMRKNMVRVKGKLPEELVYKLPPKLKDRRGFPKDYYKRTYKAIEQIILSDVIPKEFRLVDIYRAMFGTGRIIWKNKEVYNRFDIIRNTVRRLESENKVKRIGKEEVILKSGAPSARGRYVWKKLVEAEEVEASGDDIFPHTKVTRSQAMDAIKQAIFAGKLTYMKDGSFFGFDRRRLPDAVWYKLITLIAKLVKQKNLVKDVKIDFETKGLVFNR